MGEASSFNTCHRRPVGKKEQMPKYHFSMFLSLQNNYKNYIKVKPTCILVNHFHSPMDVINVYYVTKREKKPVKLTNSGLKSLQNYITSTCKSRILYYRESL